MDHAEFILNSVNNALQLALGFEGLDGTYGHYRRIIQEFAEDSFVFGPGAPAKQPQALGSFVEKCLDYLAVYPAPVPAAELRKKLETFGAVYLAVKSDYFMQMQRQRQKPLDVGRGRGLEKKKESEIDVGKHQHTEEREHAPVTPLRKILLKGPKPPVKPKRDYGHAKSRGRPRRRGR
ncbi:hypothetical protein MKEN_01056300 [Mycena kentingensis (nom. inval.)]|nr:hypothetical protein MKEN_01056300 [Mycena kentingensis (nom. inval.)]